MRRIIIVTSLLLILVLGVSQAVIALEVRQERAAIEAELADQLPRLQDYPPDTQELSRKAVSVNDQSHPLNRSNPMLQELGEAIHTYLGAYELALVVADGSSHSAFAGLYLYSYDGSTQAQSAAEVLNQALRKTDQGEAVAMALPGTTYTFTVSDGDQVYYFVGTQDNVLRIFVVNGSASETLETTYQALGEHFLLR